MRSRQQNTRIVDVGGKAKHCLGMLREQAEDLISEYLGSEHRLFLSEKAKESAEPILLAFFQAAAKRGIPDLQALTARDVDAVLMQDMPHLQLPVAARKSIPDLLTAFFDFLRNSGRWPAAGSWAACTEALAPKFQASIREDGSVRGETYRKAGTPTGRNDPCPCGSGKKYKKCCAPLFD
jgi:SEC-C motif